MADNNNIYITHNCKNSSQVEGSKVINVVCKGAKLDDVCYSLLHYCNKNKNLLFFAIEILQ